MEIIKQNELNINSSKKSKKSRRDKQDKLNIENFSMKTNHGEIISIKQCIEEVYDNG